MDRKKWDPSHEDPKIGAPIHRNSPVGSNVASEPAHRPITVIPIDL